MAMTLHVNSWVLLGVVADGCPMDTLERREFISWSVLVFTMWFLGVQIHITAHNNLQPKDYLVAAARRRAHQLGPRRTLQAGQILPQHFRDVVQNLWTSCCL